MYHVHVHHKIRIKGGKCLHFYKACVLRIHIHNNVNTFTSCVPKKGYPSSNQRFQSQTWSWNILPKQFHVNKFITHRVYVCMVSLPTRMIDLYGKLQSMSRKRATSPMYPTGHEIHGGFMTGIPGNDFISPRTKAPCNYPKIQKVSTLLRSSGNHPPAGRHTECFPLHSQGFMAMIERHFRQCFWVAMYYGRIYQRVNLPQITVSTRHDLSE